MSRSAKVIVALILCCSLLCGCSALIPDEVEYQALTDTDLTITLPSYFENMSAYDDTVPTSGFFAYGYSEILITGLRDDKAQFEAVPTLEEYRDSLIKTSGIECEIESIDGLLTFTYYQLNGNQSYTCIAAVYEGTESFWLITATCQTMNFKYARDKFIEIFKTVQVA